MTVVLKEETKNSRVCVCEFHGLVRYSVWAGPTVLCWAYSRVHSELAGWPALLHNWQLAGFAWRLSDCCLCHLTSPWGLFIFHPPRGQLGFFSIHGGLTIPSIVKGKPRGGSVSQASARVMLAKVPLARGSHSDNPIQEVERQTLALVREDLWLF